MCLEDVTLGRNTQPIVRAVTGSTVSAALVPGSGARTKLHVCPPSSGVIWLSPQPTTVAGQGYCLAAGDPPLRLMVEADGQQVLMPWSFLADAGAPVVLVIEHRLLAGSDKPSHVDGGHY